MTCAAAPPVATAAAANCQVALGRPGDSNSVGSQTDRLNIVFVSPHVKAL